MPYCHSNENVLVTSEFGMPYKNCSYGRVCLPSMLHLLSYGHRDINRKYNYKVSSKKFLAVAEKLATYDRGLLLFATHYIAYIADNI